MRWFFGLAVLGSFFLLGEYDYTLTLHLQTYASSPLARFMDDSFFEREAFGGGDLPLLVFIGGSLLYVFSHVPGFSVALRPYREALGYVLVSGLTASVYVVHTLKWLMGRPRPHRVFSGELPFGEWYAFGAHFIDTGGYRGSFPSGHVATMMLLFPWAYVLWARGYRMWAVVLGGVSLGGALVMLISRSMVGAHWLSDGWGSIWVSIGVGYGLLGQLSGRFVEPWWGLRLAAWIGAFFVAMFVSGMSWRAWLLGYPPGYAVGAVLGLGLAGLLGWSVVRLLRSSAP